MSENSVLNAAIALIENRPKDAREMLRAPGQSKNVLEVYSRLEHSLRKREQMSQVKVLKSILMQTLRIDPDNLIDSDGMTTYTEKEREAFLRGLTEVEAIIDATIQDIEP